MGEIPHTVFALDLPGPLGILVGTGGVYFICANFYSLQQVKEFDKATSSSDIIFS